MASVAAGSASSGSVAKQDLYQAVWRWHFVAGLLVMPFLVMMAITGGLYLFKDEISHALYRPLIEVPARTTPKAPISQVVRNTELATGARVVWVTIPERADRSIMMMVRPTQGEARTAYADPYDARFLGSTAYGGVMHLVRKIHSLQKFGFWASCIIEIVAGWAIIMVATGFYLWWPRGRSQGVTTIRGKPKSRVFWRDLHAVTGAFAGLVILFLAMTGMTWSLFWGVKMQMMVIRNQLYAPSAPGFMVQEEYLAIMELPPAKVPEPSEKKPWSLERMPVPTSQPLAEQSKMPPMGPGEHEAMAKPNTSGEHAAHEAMAKSSGLGEHAAHEAMARQSGEGGSTSGTPIGIDRAVQRFHELGVKLPFSVELPLGEKGIYAAFHMPQQVRGNQTNYLDQYSGKSLGKMGFADYYIGGRIIEVGNNTHMGREFGTVNRIIMLLGVLAVLLLAISSVVMWWKRRPAGKLGLPPYPQDTKTVRAFLVVMIAVGVIFPLVGLSLIVAYVVDRVITFARRSKQDA